MIPLIIKQELQRFFKLADLTFSPVGGGSINEAYAFYAGQDKFFVKFNSFSKYPHLIAREVEGLEAINDTNTIKTPELIHYIPIDDYEVLVLGYIEPQVPIKDFWQNFGQQLAAMHQNAHHNRFGWHQNNYLGSLAQDNTWNESFIPFWINQRIRPQLKMAADQQLLTSQDLEAFENLFKRLGEIFPNMTPSLVHGDLWSGNFIANNDLGPTLIDPSIHYSTAETDLAFTHLFGGFSSDFYHAYAEVNPFEKHFNERIEIYNLYPLLLHLNLFGSAYYFAINKIIQSFRK